MDEVLRKRAKKVVKLNSKLSQKEIDKIFDDMDKDVKEHQELMVEVEEMMG